jgi:hypothetical protein
MGNLCRKKIYDLQTVYKLPHSASWHTYILPDLQKFGGCQFIRIRNTRHSLCPKPEQPIVDFTKLLLIYLLLHTIRNHLYKRHTLSVSATTCTLKIIGCNFKRYRWKNIF